MDKKVVICDIDGTLVVKHTDLTARARAVIEALRKHNIYFGIASGRSMEQVKRMVQSWGFEDLDILIGFNGSLLWDGINKEEHDYFILKKEYIKEIIEVMAQFTTSNTLIYRGNQMLCSQLDEMTEVSTASSQMVAVKVDSLADFYSEDNAKIMFRVHEEDMPEIEAYFDSHPSEHFRAFKTQSSLLEFSDRRVSKAYTLQKFCDVHKINMSEVISFGDTSNDNDLLQASGWGVCLQNGSDDTKEIADEITDKPCDEDGWADYMEERFLLPRGW